jgi:hypothetical protein
MFAPFRANAHGIRRPSFSAYFASGTPARFRSLRKLSTTGRRDPVFKFDLDQIVVRPDISDGGMGYILFKCPQTGMNVQHWLEDAGDPKDTHKAVVCQACTRLHFIDGSTGKLLGDREK